MPSFFVALLLAVEAAILAAAAALLSAAAALVTAAAAVPAPPAPARRRHRGLISSRGPRRRLGLLAQVQEDLAAAAAAARQLQAPGAEAVPEAAQADKRTVHGEPLYDEPQRMPIPGNYKTTEVSDMPDGHMVEPLYIGDELAVEDLQAQAAGSAVFAAAAAVDVAEPCSRGLRTTRRGANRSSISCPTLRRAL